VTADLGEFLQRGARRTREPCVWDCCAFPSAWALECGDGDAMAAWRGTYDTESDGERIAREGGGLVVLFARGFGSIGWHELPAGVEHRVGDVAVISLLGREAGAVYTGSRWAFVATRGLGFVTLEERYVRQAWRRPGHG
jgi:hypothetical protein